MTEFLYVCGETDIIRYDSVEGGAVYLLMTGSICKADSPNSKGRIVYCLQT